MHRTEILDLRTSGEKPSHDIRDNQTLFRIPKNSDGSLTRVLRDFVSERCKHPLQKSKVTQRAGQSFLRSVFAPRYIYDHLRLRARQHMRPGARSPTGAIAPG